MNWARVLAQVVYYFHAYYATGQKPLAFSVPTGNFGDIFAGWLAAKMGLPITQLILATNENDILSVFFNTGRYARGDVKFTISPSMDIQVASNFERFLFYRLGQSAEALREAMESFAQCGAFHLDDGAPIDDLICARAVGREETLATIAAVHEEEGYLLDPHTAVGRSCRASSPHGRRAARVPSHGASFEIPRGGKWRRGRPPRDPPPGGDWRGCRSAPRPCSASEDAVKAFIEAHGRSEDPQKRRDVGHDLIRRWPGARPGGSALVHPYGFDNSGGRGTPHVIHSVIANMNGLLRAKPPPAEARPQTWRAEASALQRPLHLNGRQRSARAPSAGYLRSLDRAAKV